MITKSLNTPKYYTFLEILDKIHKNPTIMITIRSIRMTFSKYIEVLYFLLNFQPKHEGRARRPLTFRSLLVCNIALIYTASKSDAAISRKADREKPRQARSHLRCVQEESRTNYGGTKVECALVQEPDQTFAEKLQVNIF